VREVRISERGEEEREVRISEDARRREVRI
jgi:hypothetical protein